MMSTSLCEKCLHTRQCVITLKPDDDRNIDTNVLHRSDDNVGNYVALNNATENVDQYRLYIAVGQYDLECFADPLPGGSTADGPGSLPVGHHAVLPGPIVPMANPAPLTHAADVTFQRHVVQAKLRCLVFPFILLG